MIRDEMARGRPILDIGASPKREFYPEPTSDFYAAEHEEVYSSGYENYAQAWVTDEEIATMAGAAMMEP